MAPALLLAMATALLLAAAPAAKFVILFGAREATQGVAVDADHFYAVGNSTIARYDQTTWKKEAVWRGDRRRFPHLNSCSVLKGELVCAASNYPKTPMESRVEVFDPIRLQHLRTVDLGRQSGSLTFVDWKDGSWWAGFANYDGRGGEKGRDHRASRLVRFDAGWRPKAAWTFPPSVLARMKPYGPSGGAFGKDGLLYVTGHDRPEIYVLEAPEEGVELRLAATIAAPFNGQAIAFDPDDDRVLFGIRRSQRAVVVMRLPPVAPSGPRPAVPPP